MRSNRKIVTILLTSISIASILWVIYKIWIFDEWKNFYEHLLNNLSYLPWLIAVQLALLIINISLETGKWQLLTQHIQKLSFRQSLNQVIRGIQLGLITPARTGEPIGRSIFYPKNKRAEVVILSLTGSILQNTVILVTTAWAIILAGSKSWDYLTFFSQNGPASRLIWITGIFTILIIVLFSLFPGLNPAKRFSKYLRIQLLTLKKTGFRNLLIVGLLTIIRHSVFCLQFLILLQYFGLTETMSDIYLVFIFFGAITFLPSVGAGDLGIRASVALFIFGESTLTGPGIIMASMSLWLVNLALPSLIPTLWKTTKKIWLLLYYKAFSTFKSVHQGTQPTP